MHGKIYMNWSYANQHNIKPSIQKSTFATHGQVVSTIWTFFSLKVNISSTAAPKAGNMTTSPLLTTSNCFPLSSRGIFWTFISSSRCINNLSMLKKWHAQEKGQQSTIEFRTWINFYQLPELNGITSKYQFKKYKIIDGNRKHEETLLTVGLWMISLVIQIVSVGNCFLAS